MSTYGEIFMKIPENDNFHSPAEWVYKSAKKKKKKKKKKNSPYFIYLCILIVFKMI